MGMTYSPHFEKLFQVGHIGKMELKNRIVLPPMMTSYADNEGYVTPQMKDHYEARARGGTGLIIVEITCIQYPEGSRPLRELAIDDDKFIPGLKQLARTIRKHGAKAALQLHHAGVMGSQPVAPSSAGRTGWLGVAGSPRELSVSEITDIVTLFATGAERAKEAGFNGVEIHAAHNYLIADFLSSYWNKRTDAYGGDLKNRAKFLLEIVRAVRKSVGPDYPMWCRINGQEEGTGGFTIDEAKETALMLQDAGVDALNVSSAAWYPNWHFPDGLSSGRQWIFPRGWQVHLAEEIKKVVRVPVIAVGRIDPELGEKILRQGKADFIAMGRALQADPELPNKAASGRLDDIVPCIACNECYTQEESMVCTINAAKGKEREYTIRPAARSKKVLIVGGGPAGLEAARVAAIRGHNVTLYEKDQKLGGALSIVCTMDFKSGMRILIDYLKTQVGKLDVKVELDKEVTPAVIDGEKPDVVIIATGAIPYVPEIPGVNRANVATAVDVISGRTKVGQKVVVIGGELVGCDTAEFLAEKGKRVTIMRRGATIAAGAPPTWGGLIRNRLVELGVTMITEVKGYKEITDRGLVFVDRQGKKRTIEADSIVLATGARPNTKLFDELEGRFPEIYLIGDCVAPRRALHAIAEGSRIAREI